MHEAITNRQVFNRYLTEREEKQLLHHVKSIDSPYAKRDLYWMTLARQTGIRIGSIAGLTVADARDALAVKRLTLRDDIVKGRRGYSVPLNTGAMAALRALLKLRVDLKLTADADAPLIWSRQSQRMTVRQFQLRMQYWVTQSKLSVKATPHWWRHTLAKRLMERSVGRDPQAFVQASLGHHSRDSTAVYTLPDREDLAAALQSAC
ncbi:MAG: tyrosine-type recombinase/integrase [Pseudomonadota bacterium]|nr:tyrosine-type recombinase/integrase [Pseudomonadota bacterium]